MSNTVETAKFLQRFRMIVHTQVQHRIEFGALDLERSVLLAAFVAAFRLPGIERAHQALGEGMTGEHVAGHRDTSPDRWPHQSTHSRPA